MNSALEQILQRIHETQGCPGFLDVLFRENKELVQQGTPVVLYGAGACGAELCSTLRIHGIRPVCFCDSGESQSTTYCDIPLIPFDTLTSIYRDALIVVASHKFQKQITDRLLDEGFSADRVHCKPSDTDSSLVYMYSMVGTHALIESYQIVSKPKNVLQIYKDHQEDTQAAYNLLSDDHSKGLFISKLALLASEGRFELFKAFIQTYSQPLLEFGCGNYEGTPEDYYYFNNDVLTLAEGEVLIDVGAYDGDTVETFVKACEKRGVHYRSIHAFEPDPHCYQALLTNTKGLSNIVCRPLGVWSQSQTLRFNSSENALHDQAGAIDHTGNIEIQVVSLDDYLQDVKPTFIKMDPGGNVIMQALEGASRTISSCKPKLALGAYHGPKSMFEIPLLVNRLCPDYRIFLRHNTFHLCDTDLLATL